MIPSVSTLDLMKTFPTRDPTTISLHSLSLTSAYSFQSKYVNRILANGGRLNSTELTGSRVFTKEVKCQDVK